MRFLTRLKTLAPNIATLYFSISLPWCLQWFVRAILVDSSQNTASKIQWIWLSLGIIALILAIQPVKSDMRTRARWFTWGYVANVAAIVVFGLLFLWRVDTIGWSKIESWAC